MSRAKKVHKFLFEMVFHSEKYYFANKIHPKSKKNDPKDDKNIIFN